jgi:hypothetical protein
VAVLTSIKTAERSRYWKGTLQSASTKIPKRLWNPKFWDCLHNSPFVPCSMGGSTSFRIYLAYVKVAFPTRSVRTRDAVWLSLGHRQVHLTGEQALKWFPVLGLVGNAGIQYWISCRWIQHSSPNPSPFSATSVTCCSLLFVVSSVLGNQQSLVSKVYFLDFEFMSVFSLVDIFCH